MLFIECHGDKYRTQVSRVEVGVDYADHDGVDVFQDWSVFHAGDVMGEIGANRGAVEHVGDDFIESLVVGRRCETSILTIDDFAGKWRAFQRHERVEDERLDAIWNDLVAASETLGQVDDESRRVDILWCMNWAISMILYKSSMLLHLYLKLELHNTEMVKFLLII